MQRDGFRCKKCGEDDKQLHVHHILYDDDFKNPWDYPDHLLITICCNCHEIEGNILPMGLAKSVLNNLIYISGKTLDDIDRINIDAFYMQKDEGYTLKEALKISYLKFLQGL